MKENSKRKWKQKHDYLLCKGILKHGYYHWNEIMTDKQIWIRKNNTTDDPVKELATILIPFACLVQSFKQKD